MTHKIRDFTISGLAILPTLLWLLTGSVEVFAVTACVMLLAALTVAMAAPPAAESPERTDDRQRQ